MKFRARKRKFWQLSSHDGRFLFVSVRPSVSLTFKVDGDEGSRHGRVARQEERPALLEASGEAVADRVHAQVGPVVAHADHDGRLAILG